MHIVLDSKKLIKEIERIRLKGKYFSSGGAKNDSLPDAAVIEAIGDDLLIYNGNHICICYIKMTGITVIEEGEMTVEINRLLSHLKVFKGSINIQVSDKIVIDSNVTGKSALPLLLNHPNPAIIARIKLFDKNAMVWDGEDETEYVVGKTVLPTALNISSLHFEGPVKGCDNIDMGRYKFDFDEEEETFTLSTSSSPTNYFTSLIRHSTWKGESATVEFSGPFFSFFEGERITIRMSYDAPVVIASEDRAIIKAPFVEG